LIFLSQVQLPPVRQVFSSLLDCCPNIREARCRGKRERLALSSSNSPPVTSSRGRASPPLLLTSAPFLILLDSRVAVNPPDQNLDALFPFFLPLSSRALASGCGMVAEAGRVPPHFRRRRSPIARPSCFCQDVPCLIFPLKGPGKTPRLRPAWLAAWCRMFHRFLIAEDGSGVSLRVFFFPPQLC